MFSWGSGAMPCHCHDRDNEIDPSIGGREKSGSKSDYQTLIRRRSGCGVVCIVSCQWSMCASSVTLPLETCPKCIRTYLGELVQ